VKRDQSTIYSESGLRNLQDHIDQLRVDLGAFGSILQDQSGRLLVECGSHGYIDIHSFMVLLGNAMSATDAVMQVLHDESSFDLHIHEGTTYEIYTSRISKQIFLTFIFEKRESGSRVGIVWLTLRRAVNELRALLREATLKEGAVEDKEIKNAVASSFTEMLGRLDDDLLGGSTPPVSAPARAQKKSSPPPEPAPDEPPSRESKPVRKRLGASFSWADDASRDKDSSSVMKKPEATPPPPPPPPTPTPEPDLEGLDPTQPISFEEARRRGLINFDIDPPQ
jgi:hypothetical protein